jgi:hypothetical protein
LWSYRDLWDRLHNSINEHTMAHNRTYPMKIEKSRFLLYLLSRLLHWVWCFGSRMWFLLKGEVIFWHVSIQVWYLLTSCVRQRNNINIYFCFIIIALHVSTPLGHHQVLPLKQLLLYSNVTFQIIWSWIKLIRSSLLNQLKFLYIFLKCT